MFAHVVKAIDNADISVKALEGVMGVFQGETFQDKAGSAIDTALDILGERQRRKNGDASEDGEE